MSNTDKTLAAELETEALDQVVGGAARGVVVHDARRQEQADKLNSEEDGKDA